MKPCPATVQLNYYVRHIYNFNIFSSHTVKEKKRQKFKGEINFNISYLSQYIKYYFNMESNAKQLHNSFSSLILQNSTDTLSLKHISF